MKITVNFDCNWNKSDIETILKNPNLSAQELNMDIDTYLEAMVVASLMKHKNLSVSDAIEEGRADIAADIDAYFFEEMVENYIDYYKQKLSNAA